MKQFVRLFIILAAFLVMISSVITLSETENRTPIYLNVAAMFMLCVVITLLNLNKTKKD